MILMRNIIKLQTKKPTNSTDSEYHKREGKKSKITFDSKTNINASGQNLFSAHRQIRSIYKVFSPNRTGEQLCSDVPLNFLM